MGERVCIHLGGIRAMKVRKVDVNKFEQAFESTFFGSSAGETNGQWSSGSLGVFWSLQSNFKS